MDIVRVPRALIEARDIDTRAKLTAIALCVGLGDNGCSPMTWSDIGAITGLSTSTVRRHVREVLSPLGYVECTQVCTGGRVDDTHLRLGRKLRRQMRQR